MTYFCCCNESRSALSNIEPKPRIDRRTVRILAKEEKQPAAFRSDRVRQRTFSARPTRTALLRLSLCCFQRLRKHFCACSFSATFRHPMFVHCHWKGSVFAPNTMTFDCQSRGHRGLKREPRTRNAETASLGFWSGLVQRDAFKRFNRSLINGGKDYFQLGVA